MQQSNTINIQHFLNENRFSPYQWMIFVICFLTTFFDGMDTAAIGYVAPHLLKDWDLQKSDLAPVLSAALFGLAIGAIVSGPLADRFGRKIVLTASVMLFSVMCTASAYADNLRELENLRFATGLGLGAAMPNAVTLLSEYCPDSKRSMIVNTMYCGFPLGAAVGGFLASYLIPTHGWESVFTVCGEVPLVMSVIMIFVLPESARHMLARNFPAAKIRSVLRRINNDIHEHAEFVMIEQKLGKVEGKHGLQVVLSGHYLLGTVLLCCSYFFGLIIFYSMINWMPTLITEANMSKEMGARIGGLFALGGLGAIYSGWLMDRFNADKLIAFISFLTAVSVAFIGFALKQGVWPLVVVVLLAGIFQNTAQTSLPALAAAFFPTSGRTTGVSLMLGIGRFGAIAGTFLTSWLVGMKLDFTTIFIILAIPSLVLSLCVMWKYFVYGNSKVEAGSSVQH